VILLENIQVWKKNTDRILLDIDQLMLDTKQITGLTGPSGCGKSVLLKLISGLMPSPDHFIIQGCIRYDLPGLKMKVNIAHPDIQSIQLLRKSKLFSIFQYLHSGLSPVHKASEMVRDILLKHNKELLPAIEQKGLELRLPTDWVERYPEQLSGGEIQRIQLLCGLLSNASFFLCDEISTALDHKNEVLVFEHLMRYCSSADIGAFIVSHDIRLLQQHCTVIYEIEKGHLELLGKSMNCKEHEGITPYILQDNVNSTELIKIENLRISYNLSQGTLLKTDLVALHTGRIYMLTGASGSGKSTLCKIVSGLQNPQDGIIYYRKKALNTLSLVQKKVFHHKVHYLHQDALAAFHPLRKLGKSLKLMQSSVKQMPDKKEYEAFDLLNLLKIFSLSKQLLDSYPKELSGGELHRFQVLQALLFQPELVILDEVFSALDPSSSAEMMEGLEFFSLRFGISFIIVSHHRLQTYQMKAAQLIIQEGTQNLILVSPTNENNK
jgi:ABC-type glutathione transport system ATPase component